MRDIIEGPPEEHDTPLSWSTRLIWFVGLAVAGTTATAAVAYALRALLRL